MQTLLLCMTRQLNDFRLNLLPVATGSLRGFCSNEPANSVIALVLKRLVNELGYLPTQIMSFSGYRGGRRPWRGSTISTSSQGPIRTPPAPPLGPLLERLTPDQQHPNKHDIDYKLEITDTKFLASYNWTDAKDPSIIFPGKSKPSKPT
jgi:hypothetical protein